MALNTMFGQAGHARIEGHKMADELSAGALLQYRTSTDPRGRAALLAEEEGADAPDGDPAAGVAATSQAGHFRLNASKVMAPDQRSRA